MRKLILFLTLLAVPVEARPIYLWLEADRFRGVEGMFAYWTGRVQPLGAFAITGPGISAEWTQGGESEWNSMGAPAEEQKARAQRDVVIPRAGRWRVWVRHVDHRRKKEPFVVAVTQGGSARITREMGITPVVPENDEWALYWGFSFGWAFAEGTLEKGPATVSLAIDKVGEGWRQIDAVVLTDDLAWTPVGREKPDFAYVDAMSLEPQPGVRGAGVPVGRAWKRAPLGGEDFTMWTMLYPPDAKSGKLADQTLVDAQRWSAPHPAIRTQFLAEYKKETPLVGWPRLRPGWMLGTHVAPGSPVGDWMTRNRAPFFILTNYQKTAFDDKSGPANFKTLSDGALAGQFLGFIHGEAFGSVGVGLNESLRKKDRRAHVDALVDDIVDQQRRAWSSAFKTEVPATFWNRSASCLASDLGNAMVHAFRDKGARLTCYEEDSTVPHVPLRLAFHRGAARQYADQAGSPPFFNYASGNFGDACTSFSKEPEVPRGAPSWFHSKYAVTDGPSIVWYRKMYYLNHLGGASAIFWEQGLRNQFFQPGPGNHPVQLTPFGRVTQDFQAYVDRTPERGEPYTPVALLLSYGHGYERASFRSRSFQVLEEAPSDVELRGLVDVLYYPAGVVEGQPAAPDVQSIPGGRFGNIFDILVDRPGRQGAIDGYEVVWLAGDVQLDARWQAALRAHVERGGTVVTHAGLPLDFAGWKARGSQRRASTWQVGTTTHEATPFDVAEVELEPGTTVLATAEGSPLVVRRALGKGAVLTSLVPRQLGVDERPHPVLAWLASSVLDGILPVDVRLADGSRPRGEVMYQVNRTRDGWLVLLVSTRGVDKTPSGVARVDRRAVVDLVVKTARAPRALREMTTGRELPAKKEIAVRLEPGDLQVLHLKD